MRVFQRILHHAAMAAAFFCVCFGMTGRTAWACYGCSTGSCVSCTCGCASTTAGGGGNTAADGAYDASNMTLLSYLNHNQLSLSGNGSGITASGMWGWTDPLNGREYALVGRSNGTVFVDITNPTTPVIVGELPTNSGNSPWRELATYQNTLYVVSDGNGGHGMQVFDLTRLRGVTTPQTFTADSVYYGTGMGSSHTISVNTTSGHAFLNGSNQFWGRVNMVSLADPMNPTFLTGYGWQDSFEYVHDAQALRYSGPDTRYTNKDLLITSNGDKGIAVLDVTNGSISEIASPKTFPGIGYAHQGWLTEDQRYFLANDEFDEGSNPFTRTHVWDMADLTNPTYLGYYQHTTKATDHNLFIKGNLLYETNYTAGLRVFDLSNLESAISSAVATRAPGDWNIPNAFVPVGYFDTKPGVDSPGFSGAWHNYPYFDSGTILINDIEDGLFIVRLNAAAPEPSALLLAGSIAPLTSWRLRRRKK
jgi:choice-of-anchor B domain-containing protein